MTGRWPHFTLDDYVQLAEARDRCAGTAQLRSNCCDAPIRPPAVTDSGYTECTRCGRACTTHTHR